MNDTRAPLKIAFVVMPFGKKKTNAIPDSEAPAEIDFDKLWQEAYRPALEKEGYLPVRADEQEGGLIARDVLAQLMLADIVVSDISIPNANVYYETGIRHGGGTGGCLLLAADWARPVFDLEQIRRVTYPLSQADVFNDRYDRVKAQIRDALQRFDMGQNRVRELLNEPMPGEGESDGLREAQDALRRFQTDIAACRCRMGVSFKSARECATAIVANSDVSRLPSYCVRELFELTRDVLGWRELVRFYESLDNVYQSLPWFIEQISWAKSRLGETAEAIAHIEMLNKTHGPTTERCRLLGNFYKQQYQTLENIPKRKRALNIAIAHYEHGMLMDLNEYRCAVYLLALYVLRNEATDKKLAGNIAEHIPRVCDHKRIAGSADPWGDIARLMVAFFHQNEMDASALAADASRQSLANWEFAHCIELLEILTASIPTDHQEPFLRIVDDFKATISISQEAVVSRIAEVLHTTGKDYEKFREVRARLAKPGEEIASIVASGRETVNTAQAGDYVVQNQTGAKELYIVNASTFSRRYELLTQETDGWGRYRPVGKVRGIIVDRGVLSFFNQEDAFYISAPWQEAQVVAEGDMLVTTLPLSDPIEVYRIARREFLETYREITDAKLSADNR